MCCNILVNILQFPPYVYVIFPCGRCFKSLPVLTHILVVGSVPTFPAFAPPTTPSSPHFTSPSPRQPLMYCLFRFAYSGHFIFFSSKFKINWPIYGTLLVSDVEFNNSSVVYNTQYSSHHVSSLMPTPSYPIPLSVWTFL